MTSGRNNFIYFAENQLTKFSARAAGNFSDAQFSRIFFQDFPGRRILNKKIQDFPGGMGTLKENDTCVATVVAADS